MNDKCTPTGGTAMQPAACCGAESRPNRRSTWTYRPNVDIHETPDAVVLVADVPGAEPGGIDVSLEGGILTIQAEVAPRSHGRAHSIAHEYGVGSFHRRFEIEEPVDADGVTADCREGVFEEHDGVVVTPGLERGVALLDEHRLAAGCIEEVGRMLLRLTCELAHIAADADVDRLLVSQRPLVADQVGRQHHDRQLLLMADPGLLEQEIVRRVAR